MKNKIFLLLFILLASIKAMAYIPPLTQTLNEYTGGMDYIVKIQSVPISALFGGATTQVIIDAFPTNYIQNQSATVQNATFSIHSGYLDQALGVGTTSPNSIVHVVDKSTSSSNLVLQQASSITAVYPLLVVQRSSGTPDSPSNVLNQTPVGGLMFKGYNDYYGPEYITAASIVAFSSNPSGNDLPSYMQFNTAQGVRVVQERMRLDQNGMTVQGVNRTSGNLLVGYSPGVSKNLVNIDGGSSVPSFYPSVNAIDERGVNKALLINSGTGYIGTGTLFPTSKFDVVNGSITVRGSSAGVNIAGIDVMGAINSTAALSSNQFAFAFSSISTLQVATGTLAAQTTYNVLNPSNTNYVNLSGSTQTKTGGFNIMGSVGIGTTAPTSGLDVSGGSLTVRGANAGVAVGSSSFLTPTVLTVAGQQIYPGWFNSVNTSTASLQTQINNFSTSTTNLTPSNTNYLTVLSSTQTKNGGLTIGGTLTSAQDANFGNVDGSSTTVFDKMFVKQYLTSLQTKAFANDGGGGSASSDIIYGWGFRPQNVTMQLTHLGYYASSLVSGTREVAIFSTSPANKLGSVFVSTNDAQNGLYRYQALSTPLTLSTTMEYAILAAVPGNENRPQQASAYSFGFSTNVYFVTNKTYNQAGGPTIPSLISYDTIGDIMIAPGNFLFRPLRDVITVRDGNVGIGTSTPNQKLEISGNLSTVDGTGNAWAIRGSTSNYSIQYVNDGSRYPIRFVGDSDAGTPRWFEFGNYTSNQSSNTWNSKVSINSSGGNVGIGTSTPDRTLAIKRSAVSGSLTGGSFVVSDYTAGTMELYQSNAESQWRSNVGLGLSANNSSASNLYINTGGSVGIGTSAPASHVDIFAAESDIFGLNVRSSFGHQLRSLAGTCVGCYNGLVQQGDNAIIFSSGSIETGGLVIGQHSASNKGIRINPSGNVGIGTAAPGYKLDVLEPVLGSTIAYFNNSASDGLASVLIRGLGDNTVSRSQLILRQDGSGGPYDLRLAQSGVNTSPIGGGLNNSGALTTLASKPLHLGTGNTARMTIDTSGNVGIGTTGPAFKLHVHELGSGEGARLQLTNADSGTTSGDGFQVLLGGTEDAWVWNYENTGLHFGTNSTERMTILAGGDVGIGTTNPGAKLHVYGSGNEKIALTNSSLTSPDRSSLGIDSSEGFQILTGRTNSNHNNFTLRTGDFDNSSSARLTVLGANGNVGIGTNNPAYQLELNTDSAGKPTTNTWTITSDSRTKEDISEYTVGLNEIKQIRPITFVHNGLGGTHKGDQGVGVLAQEMRSIFPQTVTEREKIFESTDDVKGFDAERVVTSSAVTREDWTVFNEPEGLMSGTTFFQKDGGGNGVVFKDNSFYFLFPRGNTGKYTEVKNTNTGFVYNLENGGFFSAQSEIVEVSPEKHGYKAKILGFNSHEITFALVNAVKQLDSKISNNVFNSISDENQNLNVPFQLSSTQTYSVNYKVKETCAVSGVSSGQWGSLSLDISTSSTMVPFITIDKDTGGLTGNLGDRNSTFTQTQVNTLKVGHDFIPPGAWLRLRTDVVTGAPTFEYYYGNKTKR